MKKKVYLNLVLVLLIFTTSAFFILIYPPEIITKLIVKNNYRYFVLGNNNNKYKNLLNDFIVQNYFRNNFLKKNKNVSEIMYKTKRFLLDQDEAKIYKSKIILRNSNISLGSIIIYGFGACESINGILALKLSKNFNNVKTYALLDQSTGLSPHTLVKINYKNKNFYLDIWGNNRNLAFTLEKSNLNKEFNINIFSSNMYKSFKTSNNIIITKKFFNDGFILKKFSLYDYFKASILKINQSLISFKENNKNQHHINKIIKVNNSYITEKQLIMLFIDARFEHINGNVEEAYRKYKIISNQSCNLSFCKVVKLLLKKSNKNI